MTTFNPSSRLQRAVLGATLLGSLALASLGAKETTSSLSFERKEGFKPGTQASSATLSTVDGTFSVVEGRAPDGVAFLQFEGRSEDSLGLLALPQSEAQSLEALRFALRAPFTEQSSDLDYVVAGGAVIGVAQTERDVVISFPVDRQGDNWRELRLSRDLSLAKLPADWSLFEVRRDSAGRRWDLSWNHRVLATGLPLAADLGGEDSLAISGFGPVGLDDLKLDFAALAAAPDHGKRANEATLTAVDLREKHRGKPEAGTDAKGRRGPAWGRAADPDATSVAPESAATTAAHLELFLPKP